jgi:hypothetical protein
MSEKKLILRRTFPNRRTWLRELTRQRGAEEASRIIKRVGEKYAKLLANSHAYHPRVLQKYHFEGNILPAIAVFQVLLEKGEPPPQALKCLDDLLEANMAGQKRLYKLLGKLSFFFDLLRLTLKPLTLMQYPRQGWRLEFPDLGRDVVALNGYGCFYLGVLTEYGLPELTQHFCHLDDFLFEGITDRVRWERKQTIGRGGKMCDFRYYRVKTKQG